MAKLHLRILTVEKTIYDDLIDELILPTETGMIGVLGNHSPLVTIIKTGEMIIRKDGKDEPFAISGGILEVRPGSQAIILAEESERAPDISIERAEKSFKETEELLANEELQKDLSDKKKKINKEQNRINIARKWQTK